jgi:hypothetical protein
MAKVTIHGWQTDVSNAAQPTTGIVIPFRPRKVVEKAPPWSYYGDLDEMLQITNRLAYPAIGNLLTGLILRVLKDKNGADVKASLEDLKEFVRGLRYEIRNGG